MSLSSMTLSSSHLVAPREMNVVKPKSAISKVIVRPDVSALYHKKSQRPRKSYPHQQMEVLPRDYAPFSVGKVLLGSPYS